MSVTSVADPDRMLKSFHRRNYSGELDVFEAARYFSGYNDAASYNCATFSHKMRGRFSLDVPMAVTNPLPQQSHVVEKQIKDKKYKQPSSPGGRLASFLNSLFNQTGSKKKKKSKSDTQSMKHEDESPGGRRKRRSSISHFRSSSTADTKSFYSSSSSGFRTPSPYAHTATMSHKEFRSYSDPKQVLSLSKNRIGPTKSAALQNAVIEDKRNTDTTEKHKNLSTRHQEKGRNFGDRYLSDEKESRKFTETETETDDGADSDSSSDLFELQNYDIGIYSSGLPVYETTHMDTIQRGAPISNGAIGEIASSTC